MEAPKARKHYFLLSWKLWKHLRYPHENAVFTRLVTQKRQHKFTISEASLALLCGGIIGYGVVSHLRPLGLEFPIVTLIVLAIFSSIITVLWLVTIAANITHEHQQATYDLICVSPLGKIGVNWSIATGTLHRQNLFRFVELARRWFTGLILLVQASVLLPIILTTVGDGRNRPYEGVMLCLDVLVFVISTYVEYIQTVLQGVLIAMLVPRYVHRAANVGVWTTVAFITLQVVMITVFLLGGIVIQFVFTANNWQYPSILPQLVLLFVMREICIFVLWKSLSHQLNAKAYDLNQV